MVEFDAVRQVARAMLNYRHFLASATEINNNKHIIQQVYPSDMCLWVNIYIYIY